LYTFNNSVFLIAGDAGQTNKQPEGTPWSDICPEPETETDDDEGVSDARGLHILSEIATTECGDVLDGVKKRPLEDEIQEMEALPRKRERKWMKLNANEQKVKQKVKQKANPKDKVKVKGTVRKLATGGCPPAKKVRLAAVLEESVEHESAVEEPAEEPTGGTDTAGAAPVVEDTVEPGVVEEVVVEQDPVEPAEPASTIPAEDTAEPESAEPAVSVASSETSDVAEPELSVAEAQAGDAGDATDNSSGDSLRKATNHIENHIAL
jgi:hypothetical protein